MNIPSEYAEFRTLFQKKSNDEAFLKHQLWDHEIRLIPEKELIKKLIYPLLKDKAVALADYIKKNK